jgi:rhamnosyltransferase subunit B
MATILMSTFGSYGNTVPFLRIGEQLIARGHEVHLWTNYPFVGSSCPLGVKIHLVGGKKEYGQFTDDAALLNRFQTLATVFRRHYLPVVEVEFAEMEHYYQPGRSILLANDAPGITSRLLAEKHRVPLISVFTYPNQIESASLIGTLLGSKMRSEIGNIRATIELPAEFDARIFWNRPHHYFALWPAWFRRNSSIVAAKTSFPGFLYFDKELQIPDDCACFLDHPDPCVLISGGSARFAGDTFLNLALETVRSVGLRAIVVARSYIENTSEILHKDSVPSLSAIMRRVAAVIHHGGMGTIGQAMRAGIPQLVLSDGGDRPENGTIVEHLGFGLNFAKSDWKAERLGPALLEVVKLPAFRQAAALAAQRIDEAGGVAAIISTLERMADRAQIVESCVYARTRTSPVQEAGSKYGNSIAEVLAGMSPERRYFLARALKSRRP